MIKVFYFYFHKDKYYSSSPIVNNFKILFQNHPLFIENEIELTPFTQFIDIDNTKMLFDIPKNKMAEHLYKAMDKITEILPNITQKYKKIIFLAFHPTPFQPFIRNHKILKKYSNIKTLLWQDDLQAYFDNPNYTHKLDYPDHIITPSPIYFSNIAPNYLKKSTFFFYSADFEENEQFCQPWNERIHKIILTGCVNQSYKIRHDIAVERTKNTRFEKITDFIKKPRSKEYNYKNKDNLPYGKNYYKILGKYKGAFFAYYQYPKNFNLAKIIEILSMGCIGFFEFSPLLEKELGLIAYKNYVPCTRNGELITKSKYYNYFLNDIDGKGTQIAKTGQEYVRENYSNLNGTKKYIDIFQKI